MKENNPLKVLIVLFIISVIILLAGLTGRGITLKVIGNFLFLKPVNNALSEFRKIGAEASNLLSLIKQKIALEKENTNLKERVSFLEEKVKLLQDMYYENQNLKTALKIKESKSNWELKFANVIGSSNLTNIIMIDKGQIDGIKKDMPVVSSLDGTNIDLIGITFEVENRVSKVLLSVNPDFKVGVKNVLAGGVEIAKGNGTGLQIESYSRNLNIKTGDIYTTSSSSDIYPSDIAVGKVKEIKSKNSIEKIILLEPTVQFEKLLNVFIITPHE